MSNKTDGQEILHPIGVVAQMFNISVSALRLYESKGLIIPLKSQDTHRYFTESNIKRVDQLAEVATIFSEFIF
ncbi:MAG: MerR family DNA-binding transcriptional regulator [Calditrichaeota bacterium]|nr:MerR family DNA-binding transcriptional regulator [Calditrichota bacterium]